MRLGVLPLGRSTFDVEYAGRKLVAALRGLDATGHEVFGSRMLLLDEDATLRAIGDLAASRVDQVLILQLTFTDARMTVAAATAFEQPLSIWAMPEPRLGGRLRLNALCGLNLASHALGLNNRAFSWLYADPDSGVAGSDRGLAGGKVQDRSPGGPGGSGGDYWGRQGRQGHPGPPHRSNRRASAWL